MFGRFTAWPALVASLWGSAVFVTPAWAEVPFRWAEVQAVVNQVEMQSADGSRRWAVPDSCLCPGDTLSTQGVSQAELRLNDGSLVRVGEQAALQVRQGTRTLRLLQGTTLIFAQPNQGRTTIETPNALTGLDHTAVVVRYVPSRDLTLVMALANAETGPISITLKASGQEGVLYAGQMALVSAEGLEIIEFDLLEFYRTSRLVMGLALDGSTPVGGSTTQIPDPDPVALLRSQLLSAVVQQAPFANSTILNPSLINDLSGVSDLTDASQEALQPIPLNQSTSPAQSPSSLPAGVVAPLPDLPAPPENTEPSVPAPPAEPPISADPLPTTPTPVPSADPPSAEPGPTGAPAPTPDGLPNATP
ncbi:MAG: FecR domain-containing protein [Spirulina sp.]